MPEQKIRSMVEETLESVGLATVLDRFPAELSGGMVKRAGFARAVISNPQCVLYDEPTTGLDPIITHVLTDLIMRLREQLNGTAVVVSHDLESISRWPTTWRCSSKVRSSRTAHARRSKRRRTRSCNNSCKGAKLARFRSREARNRHTTETR